MSFLDIDVLSCSFCELYISVNPKSRPVFIIIITYLVGSEFHCNFKVLLNIYNWHIILITVKSRQYLRTDLCHGTAALLKFDQTHE